MDYYTGATFLMLMGFILIAIGGTMRTLTDCGDKGKRVAKWVFIAGCINLMPLFITAWLAVIGGR